MGKVPWSTRLSRGYSERPTVQKWRKGREFPGPEKGLISPNAGNDMEKLDHVSVAAENAK